jgi:hypothetical protein
MNPRIVALTGLVSFAASFLVPAGVWANTPGADGLPPVSGSESVSGLLEAVVNVVQAVIPIVGGFALLVGAGFLVSRIGSGPADEPALEASRPGRRRLPSGLGWLVAIIVVLAAAALGVAVGRTLAYITSEGGLSGIFGRVYLFLFVVASFVVVLTIGASALKFRHGQLSRAIATVFGAGAILITGTILGTVTAEATGGTYHDPVVLTAPATVSVRIDPTQVTFVAQDQGPAECRSGPDTPRFADLSALDLGELGEGTLRAGLMIDTEGPGTASVELFIDGADLPEGSPMVSWSGAVAVTSMSPSGDAGTVSFSDLALSQGDGKPAPADSGSEVGLPSPLVSDWPATLTGTLDWTCQPWAGIPDASFVPSPSNAQGAIGTDKPVPSSDPTDLPEPTEFAADAPTCPAPVSAVHAPAVIVSIATGSPVMATRVGSTLETCSTTAIEDGVPGDPVGQVLGHPGDQLTLALPTGWGFIRWEGSDRPAIGDAANIWLPVDVAGAPSHVDVPVPGRLGDSVADYTLWIKTLDGRVVGQLAIRIGVSVS